MRALTGLPRLVVLVLVGALALGGSVRGPATQAEDLRLAALTVALGLLDDLCGDTDGGAPHDHATCALCPAGLTGALQPANRKAAQAGVIRVAVAITTSHERRRIAPRHPGWSGQAPPLA